MTTHCVFRGPSTLDHVQCSAKTMILGVFLAVHFGIIYSMPQPPPAAGRGPPLDSHEQEQDLVPST